jgi:hypothetical protein
VFLGAVDCGTPVIVHVKRAELGSNERVKTVAQHGRQVTEIDSLQQPEPVLIVANAKRIVLRKVVAAILQYCLETKLVLLASH